MKALRELLLGVITAGVTTVLVIGAILLALVEGMSSPGSQSGGTVAILPTFTPGVVKTLTFHPIFSSISPSPSLMPQPSPTVTILILNSQNSTCSIPDGWSQYTLMSSDSIESLAELYKISQADLMRANCLTSRSLLPGTILFVPPFAPSATSTASPTQKTTHTPVQGPFVPTVRTISPLSTGTSTPEQAH